MIRPLALIAAATLALCWPLLTHDALPRGSDVSYHALYARAFLDGLPWPAWAADANRGYGAPVFLIYGPVAPAATALATLVTGDLVQGLRTVLVLGAFLAGLSFYLATRQPLAAALYVLLPYHAVDLYDRFALAEYLAFVWLPPLFALKDRRALAACYAGLILTHVMAAWMVLLLLVPYRALQDRRNLLPPILAGAGVAAFYLLPLAVHAREVNLDWFHQPHYDYRRSFIDTLGPYGDRTGPWCVAATAAQALLAAAAFLLGGPRLFAGLALWALFLQTSWSAPLYAVLPGLPQVQFPWRFAMLQGLAVAFLSAGVPFRHWPLLLLAALPALALTLALQRVRPYDFDAALADSAPYRQRAIQEYLPRHVRPPPPFPLPPQVRVLAWTGHRRRLEVQRDAPATLRIPTFAFPGWTARVDGHEQPLVPGPTLAVQVPAGRHRVEFAFVNTWDRWLGLGVSLATLLALFGRKPPPPEETRGQNA